MNILLTVEAEEDGKVVKVERRFVIDFDAEDFDYEIAVDESQRELLMALRSAVRMHLTQNELTA